VVFGFAFLGFIGIELLNVIQIAYFSVSLLTNVPVVMVPFAQLSELANGYVYRSYEAIDTHSELFLMNVSAEFLGNCNIMLLLELLVLIIGVGMWFLSKKASNEDNHNLLNRISTSLVKDILPFLVLFNALNLSFSCGVYLRNLQSLNQSVEIAGFNWMGIVVGLVINTAILYYIFKGIIHINYETVLKDEVAEEHKLAVYYPGFLCIHKLLMGLLMGTLFDMRHRVFVILTLQLTYTVFCFARNPFKSIYMMARQLICELTILFVLVVNVVYEYAESEVYNTVWMWIEVGMIIVCILISYGCIIKEYSIFKFKSVEETHPKLPTEITELDLKDLSKHNITEHYINNLPKPKLKPKRLDRFKKNNKKL
jgi:hypothetical protein